MRKGIISVLIAFLICSVMVPFSSAFAETKPTPSVIGVNPRLISTSSYSASTTSSGQSWVYDFEIILDDNYIGTITGILSYTVASNPSTSYSYTFTRSINGSSFHITQNVNTISLFTGLGPVSSAIFTISSSNVVATSSYSFPIESMNFISSMDSYGFVPESFNTIDYSVYPLYKLNSNDEFLIATVNPANEKADDYTLIFGVNKNVYNASSFDSIFQHSSTNAYSNYTFEYVETLYRNNLAPFSIVKAHLYSNDDQTQTV